MAYHTFSDTDLDEDAVEWNDPGFDVQEGYDFDPYVYERLPPSNHGRFIRLVEVLPELNEAGSVQCYIHEISLDENMPKYQTLSYNWGTISDMYNISCNGQRLKITQTLHRALLALRLPDKSRLIWIDQLSINQQDNIEKTQQVAMMRDIYQGSSLTIAWLGDATDDTDIALKAAHRIAVAVTSDTVQDALQGRFTGPLSNQLRNLLEAGVSERVLLRCGGASLDFDELMWAVGIALVAITERSSAASIGALQHLMFLSGIRQAKRSDERLRLPRLLEAVQMFGATDPRDKFFALFGLTRTDLSRLDLQTDYSAPTDFVYTRTLTKLMKDAGNLDLLELVNKPWKSMPTMPSWVPSLEAKWPFLESLSGSRGWTDFVIGGKMRRQLVVVAAKSSMAKKNDESEEEWTATIEQAYDELSEDEEVDEPLPVLAVSQGSTLSTFVLEDNGALRLSGQLVDKVHDTSSVLEARLFDAGEYAMAIDESGTVRSALGSFGDVTKTIFRRVRDYAQALTERDQMVMMRKHITYPTGEPLLTAYRKALTAGSLVLEDEDAEKVFAKWRRLLMSAQMMARVRKTLGNFRSSGVSTLAGLIIGNQTVTRETRVFFAMTEASYGRRLSWTSKGYLALLPEAAIKGDLVVILRGGRLPFVVRPIEHGHRLIGPAYVHGIMNGEAYDEESCGDLRLV
ncbi:hypothetical protein LTR56_014449 [Elasticomyces elasticus]|nr:hypothetical protein LTR56_014449 [Elasticomyces elasticus]KAK3646507.1 hypothetical protein LTR22_014270 [Elasticomyces elasticus]KAK4908576.1 hypothetical protein LTR49_022534 [Elasticomyces elasticus]KAK5755682.1 hypothetical protein LTS12_014243 [Elasticomyces elasticus]